MRSTSQGQPALPALPALPVVPASQRLYALDWLRIAAFAVLVCYHVGMYYVTWTFHVKSPFAGPGLEPVMMLSAPWRMCLLFLVSGAATALMFQKASTAGSGNATEGGKVGTQWLRSRTKRLLLPLLCGMVLIVPPQAYFEVVHKFAYGGSYVDFLGLYFGRYKGFCDGGQCLILPTWNHLWFLPYLWVYTLLLWLLVRGWPDALRVLRQAGTGLLSGVGLALVPIGAIAVVRLALFERYPATHALAGDWFNHAMYLGMFLLGTVLADARLIWEQLARARWVALAVALAGWALVVTHHDGEAGPWVKAVVVASLQWGALASAMGFAYLHLNKDHPWRQRLTEAVFPVYVLHQTLIILLTQVLLPLHWTPRQEGPVLVLATFLLSYCGYELVRRVRILRPWFGLA